MKSESKARTPEELREDFIGQLRMMVSYWETLPNKTSREKLNGLAFSFLATIDGVSDGIPAYNLVASSHPDDKQFHIDEGSDWIEDGTVINGDVMLHEEWYKDR